MDDEFIERRVHELRPVIASLVKEPTLCAQLLSVSLITEQDETKVRSKMQSDPYDANLVLIDCVLSSQAQGKWKSFLDALQTTDYDFIRRSLMSPRNDDDERNAHAFSIIRQYTAYLAGNMTGSIPKIVTILISKNILSEVDKDNIFREQANKGDYQASLMLLDRMKSRAMPTKWYCGFLQALCDLKYDHLVEKMEPEFICKGDALFKNVGSSRLYHVTGLEENDTSISEHVISAHGDAEMDTNDLAVPPETQRTCSLNISISNHPEADLIDSNTNQRQRNMKQGRARKQNATVTLMADEKMLELDRINAYKAAMMYRALKRIKCLKPTFVETKVCNFQMEEMSKYRFKVETEGYKKGRQSEEDHDLLCGRCNVFACFVSDVRQMGSSYVVIDKDFDAKVERKGHKRPKTYDGIHKKYKMYCKKCGVDWGIIGIFKGLDYYILQIEHMRFRNHRAKGIQVYKKWQDQPYRVPKISPEDIPRLPGNQ